MPYRSAALELIARFSAGARFGALLTPSPVWQAKELLNCGSSGAVGMLREGLVRQLQVKIGEPATLNYANALDFKEKDKPKV